MTDGPEGPRAERPSQAPRGLFDETGEPSSPGTSDHPPAGTFGEPASVPSAPRAPSRGAPVAKVTTVKKKVRKSRPVSLETESEGTPSEGVRKKKKKKRRVSLPDGAAPAAEGAPRRRKKKKKRAAVGVPVGGDAKRRPRREGEEAAAATGAATPGSPAPDGPRRLPPPVRRDVPSQKSTLIGAASTGATPPPPSGTRPREGAARPPAPNGLPARPAPRPVPSSAEDRSPTTTSQATKKLPRKSRPSVGSSDASSSRPEGRSPSFESLRDSEIEFVEGRSSSSTLFQGTDSDDSGPSFDQLIGRAASEPASDDGGRASLVDFDVIAAEASPIPRAASQPPIPRPDAPRLDSTAPQLAKAPPDDEPQSKAPLFLAMVGMLAIGGTIGFFVGKQAGLEEAMTSTPRGLGPDALAARGADPGPDRAPPVDTLAGERPGDLQPADDPPPPDPIDEVEPVDVAPIAQRPEPPEPPSRPTTPVAQPDPTPRPTPIARPDPPPTRPDPTPPARPDPPIAREVEPPPPQPTPPAPPPAADLPDQPSRAQVQTALNGVLSGVRACSPDFRGTVPVTVRVAPSGRVTTAVVSGHLAGTPAGSCIARAVRGARFPAFSGDHFNVQYPFQL